MIKYATYDYKSQLTVDLFRDYDYDNNGDSIEVEGDSELGNTSSTYSGTNTFNHYIEINFNESIKNKIVACSIGGAQLQFKIKLTEKIQQKVGYFFILGLVCPFINVSSDFKTLYISYPSLFPDVVSTLYLFDDTNYDTSKAKSIKLNCISFNNKTYLDNLNTTYGSFNVIDLTSNNITNGSEVKFIGKLPYSQAQYCYKFKIEKSKFTKTISKIQGYFNDTLLLTYDFKVNKNYKVTENYILIWSYAGGICFDEDSNYYYLYCLITFFNTNDCPTEFGNKLRVLFKDSNGQSIFNFSLIFKVNDEFFNLLPMYNLNSTNIEDFNLTVPTLFIKRKNLPKFNDYNLLTIDSKYKDDDYLSFYDLNTVDYNNIIYEKSTITFDSTKYILENLKKNLDLKKPFVIKGNLKLPNEIKTSGYNFIWRIFALYFVGNNITNAAGDLQFRYHNNTNSSSLQKYFTIGSNFLLKESLIFENVELTILTGLDFIFYYNNKKINALVQTKSLVTVDKEVTEQKYADRILFGRPPSASYEQNKGTITVENLKIYQ